ncbi:MAG TPA: hypothetical protein VKA36_04830, partial [Solirubrobacterales bacterium]|nr:hypothetical protein [Solirubrobacterales bacterium]
MSTASKRQRRPNHAATTHGGRRRRGGAPSSGGERLFGDRGPVTAGAAVADQAQDASRATESWRRLEE